MILDRYFHYLLFYAMFLRETFGVLIPCLLLVGKKTIPTISKTKLIGPRTFVTHITAR